MNKKLGLAVAGALLAAASSANAGITIPAGDWTIDIGGNVNAFYTHTSGSALAGAPNKNTVQTGLLPSAIGFGGKTRQNDLDVAFQFTFFVGGDSGGVASSVFPALNGAAPQGAAGGNNINIRQAFMTVGDASWGSVKFGRDLGIYGSDAILSDMTLLGVGVGAGANGSSTLGRIGSGYMYADWVGQISYTSPNFNGFQVSGGVRQPWTNAVAGGDATNSNMGFEGKVTYDFSVSDVTGRVWASGITQKHDAATTPAYTSKGYDLGAKVAYQGLGLVGYWYEGDGLSGPASNLSGLMFLGGEKTQDSGGYVQATFTIPGVGTKLGASWGESMTKAANSSVEAKNESWIVGAYHPLTKSLNVVAEYTNQDLTNIGGTAAANQGTNKTVSLGAILFF